jgi:hypothetical protein
MSMLSKFWNLYGRYILKAAALEQLDELSLLFQSGKLDSIDTAKRLLCAEIQSKRRVPGELRRWACAIVNDLEAKDLLAWMSRVRAHVKRW